MIDIKMNIMVYIEEGEEEGMMYLLETEWGGEGTAQSRVRDKHWCQ
jgi:hypothetical protein